MLLGTLRNLPMHSVLELSESFLPQLSGTVRIYSVLTMHRKNAEHSETFRNDLEPCTGTFRNLRGEVSAELSGTLEPSGTCVCNLQRNTQELICLKRCVEAMGCFCLPGGCIVTGKDEERRLQEAGLQLSERAIASSNPKPFLDSMPENMRPNIQYRCFLLPGYSIPTGMHEERKRQEAGLHLSESTSDAINPKTTLWHCGVSCCRYPAADPLFLGQPGFSHQGREIDQEGRKERSQRGETKKSFD